MKYETHQEKILKKTIGFITPIERTFTGLGLPVLFSFLANITGAGVIGTAPMGSGKTLISRMLECMFTESKKADHVVVFQEFKKTDWVRIFDKRIYENEFFFFSVPEISAMSEYSQGLFLEKIPSLQSDGTFEYSFGKEETDLIKMTNCDCSYFIASQPPKTHALINDTTFKTLANDRCWNILIINQLRGRENISISKVKDIIASINWIKTKPSTGEELKNYFRYPLEDIKFENKDGSKVNHLTRSDLEFSKFEDLIRNQYSPDRREEQMNNILKAFVSFLNEKVVCQVHIDIFVTLFGFYIGLFNSLSLGSVEQSIKIKYGAMELLCRISALISRGKLITQELLTKEFNTDDQDISIHLGDLLASGVIRETKIKLDGTAPKRYNSKKSDKAIRNQAKELSLAGLISSRRATLEDTKKDSSVRPKQTIYEFTDEINGYFKTYAGILRLVLKKSVLDDIPQINKFLTEFDQDLTDEPKQTKLDQAFESFSLTDYDGDE